MIVIGEKINTSIKSIEAAVSRKDTGVILDTVRKQAEGGAQYVDVNCGTFINHEEEIMKWLVETVQQVSDVLICIDSPNAKAIESGLKSIMSGEPIINSVTAEKERWNSIMPLVVDYNASVIALCMDDSGIPDDPEQRLSIALRMAEEMTKAGLSQNKVFFDPMVKPVSTDSRNGLVTLETIRLIRKEIPDSHIICGLSNISFGLPQRKILNQAFLIAAVFQGLDAAIIDPLDSRLMSSIYAAEAIAGKDEYCMEYITRYRSGQLEI